MRHETIGSRHVYNMIIFPLRDWCNTIYLVAAISNYHDEHPIKKFTEK